MQVKCYWLLNHPILDVQKSDLEKNFGVNEFVMPSEDVATLWGNVPTSEVILEDYFKAIESWLKDASTSDFVVIQGEPTAAFKIVSYLLKRGVTVLAGITERRSIEKTESGKVIKTSVFEHVRFRKYSV